jgi:acyl-coenzyme A synthetase/AMP-(fatty) acid ligase
MQNKLAIIDDFRSITYEELNRYIKRFAQKLTDQKICPGNTVVITMPDCIEWCVAFLGCLHVGAIPVIISAQVHKSKLAQAIEVSRASMILTQNQRNEIILEQGAELEIEYDFNDDDIAFWLTSSGTTGEQKYIVHKFKSLDNYYNLIKSTFKVDHHSVIFSSPRLSFGYGLGISIILGLGQHATIVLTNKILSHKLLSEKISTYRITHFFSTPVFLSPLIKHNKNYIDAIKSLEVITSAGEALSQTLKQRFKEIYDKDILNGYGLSEVLSYVCTQTLNDKQDKDYRNIGKVLPGITYEIRDPQGNLCARNIPGELYVKHPCMAVCYYNDIDKTKEIFQGDWVKTNDIVYLNDRDELIYISRKDNLIKINGQYVSIDEIESVIMLNEQIEECVVYTRQNSLNMLELEAKIVINSTITAGSIRNFLKDKLEMHQIPKRILFVDYIPKTVTAKKIRKTLTSTV